MLRLLISDRIRGVVANRTSFRGSPGAEPILQSAWFWPLAPVSA